MPQLVADTFNRTVSSGWGTSSSGHTWTHIDGTDTLAVNGSAGTATGAVNTNSMKLGGSARTATDVESIITVTLSATNARAGIEHRIQDLNNYYFARINGSNNRLELCLQSAGNTTVLAHASFTVAASTAYKIRFRTQGTTIEAKAWAASGSEPGSWSVTTTDSTISAAGNVGLYAQAGATGTTITFDNFTATNLTSTLDLMMRARLKAAARTQDLAMRAGVTAQVFKDLVMRARIFAPTSTQDLAMRANIRGLGLKDMSMRARLTEAFNALPALQANQLTVQVGGYANLAILEGSWKYSETIDGRGVASFTIRDDTGNLHFVHRQSVTVTHSVRGIVFTGFVNTSKETNLYPNITNMLEVTCIDEHYLADKRAYEGNEFDGESAGDIAVALASVLANEGVTAPYAIDRDTTPADFAQGQLSGVVATANLGSTTGGDGDLELQPSGQTVTISEAGQADFATGTLTRVTAASDDALELSLTQAIKLTGTCATNIGDNLYSYVAIWLGVSVTNFASGDYLAYDVWISSTSPKIMGGPDLVCTDGSTLRDTNALDQFQMSAHPRADLTGFADDQWFNRVIAIPAALNGKQIQYASVALEGDTSGTYTVYVRHMKLFDSSNNVKQTFFEDTMQVNRHLQNKGYYNVSASQVDVFEQSGQRISPVYSLRVAGIARTSFISWTETRPVQPSGGKQSTATPVLVETSWDGGATFQPCTNNQPISRPKAEMNFDKGLVIRETFTNSQPIAGLMPGMNLSDKGLVIRETLQQNGPSPEITPQLMNVQVTVAPSYAANKNDIIDADSVAAGLNEGSTLSNVSTTSLGNRIFEGSRNWDDGNVTTGQTLYGAGNPAVSDWERSLAIRTDHGTDVRSRFDFAGAVWQDFTAEIDILIPNGNTNCDYGLVYRTTGWNNTNNSFAYLARITPTAIELIKGSNGGGNSPTTLATVGVTLTAGDWYRLKVVTANTSHQIYLNDALYISATDSSYVFVGSLGVRLGNADSSARQSGFFDNFGVMLSTLSATRVHNPIDLSSLGIILSSLIQWNADVPTNCTFVVEGSTDGGNTWQECKNGEDIPGVNASLSSTNQTTCLIRETYTTNNANATPTLSGITAYIVGQYQSNGFRVSPPLSLSPVGRVGSSLISWNATLAADLANDNSVLGIDLSPDGTTWTDVSADNGQPIPFINSQSDPYRDDFSTDQSASYTSSLIQGTEISNTVYGEATYGGNSYGGGGTGQAFWSVNTSAATITATGGNQALLLPNGKSMGDGEIWIDTERADSGGVLWHLSTDLGSCYGLSIHDSAASILPNTMRLFKTVNGVTSQIGLGAALNFTRGVPTRFKIVQEGASTLVSFDYPILLSDGSLAGGNTQTLTYTDPAPLPAGGVALRSNGGTNRYSLLRFTQYGDDVTNQSLYVRQRLSTTDPLYSPQLQDLTVSVHGNTIGNGVLIPKTTYSTLSGSTNTIAQDLDDLARQSSTPTNTATNTNTYWWRIVAGVLNFQSANAIPAPFVVTGNDMLFGARITATYNSDLYRNESIIIGGTDVAATTEIYIADDFKQAFPTGGNIDSIAGISVGGQVQSFGVQGIDTNKQWYYQQGQQGITQDPGLTPLPAGTQIEIDYNAQIQVIAKARNEGQITLLSALEGTSGVVTVVENASGLDSAAAQALAQSRIQQYGVLALDLAFTTTRPGLRIGQLLTVFLPQHQLTNRTFLITQVDYSEARATVSGTVTLLEYFAVQCTSGPIVGSWTHMYS